MIPHGSNFGVPSIIHGGPIKDTALEEARRILSIDNNSDGKARISFMRKFGASHPPEVIKYERYQ